MSHPRSRAELLRFMDYVRAKGLLNPSTAEARKASANKVLGILDENEALDVLALDLDAVVSRFGNLQGQNYTPDSLRTYKSRTKSALDDFARYLENPLAFKPNGVVREKKAKEAKKPDLNKITGEPSPDRTSAAPYRPSVSPAAESSILPIPIRPDLTVFIQGLPFDLSRAEAQKLANVVLAMASGDWLCSPSTRE